MAANNMTNEMPEAKKTVLFFAVNSAGHTNAALGIADRLRADHGCRVVFLVLGPTNGNAIKDHGHELVVLDEANPLEDFPISEDEDTSVPVDEERKQRLGRTKCKFPGFLKWPQIIRRNQHLFTGSDLVESAMKSWPIVDKHLVAELADNHDNIEAAIESFKPDLLVADAYFMPPCIAKLSTIPWIRINPANPLPIFESKLADGVKPMPFAGFELLTKEARNKIRDEEPSRWNRMVESWRTAVNRFEEAMERRSEPGSHELYRKHGIPPPEPGFNSLRSPYLNLYVFPKAIDYDQDDDLFLCPESWLRCDSLIRKPIGQLNAVEAKQWEDKLAKGMEDKKAMVFFSLGSIASCGTKLMKKWLQFFWNDTERLYVVSKGINGDKFELNPDNMIGGNYIPQTFILERADLAIVHGGNNSVTECLYYGLPMIVLPVFGDQPDNAQRIQDLGLGRRLDINRCTKEDTLQAIDDILSNKTLLEKAAKIGQEMRARDESRRIAAIMKRLLDDGHLDIGYIDGCKEKGADGI